MTAPDFLRIRVVELLIGERIWDQSEQLPTPVGVIATAQILPGISGAIVPIVGVGVSLAGLADCQR